MLSAPIPDSELTLHRPITRCTAKGHNIFISELEVMGDSIQQQLDRILALFLNKFTKLDFSCLNGRVGGELLSTPTNLCKEKVSLSFFHLKSTTQLWFLQLMQYFHNLTWEEFKHQCNLRFGPSIRSNKLGKLAKLKQKGIIVDYQTQFEILIS